MGNISNSIEKLGFDQFYLDHSTPERLEGFEIARVVAVHKDKQFGELIKTVMKHKKNRR